MTSTTEASPVQEVILHEDDPTKVVKVGFTELPHLREQVIQLLREYKDVFAWSSLDMTGVSPQLITHKLNIDPEVKPIKQKQRSFAAEQNQVIKTEVKQLLDAGILFKVTYPTWIVNPVIRK